MRLPLSLACAVALVASAAPQPAGAWGATGHHLINLVAAETLPDSLPTFVRTPQAVAEIAALGSEADRLKGAGQSWDADLDPGHFLDLDDDGTIAGVVPLADLPPTREAYDTAIRKGHTVEGRAPDEYKIGYLPYSIIDGWEQVVKDFAIWRVDSVGETKAASASDRAYFAADRQLREILTIRDIGYWGHFIGDGSQPLHVSVHYNGWGDYLNPQNFTQAHIHARFETEFVDAHATEANVHQRVGAYVPSAMPIFARTEAYLLTTNKNMLTVYKLDQAGAIDQGQPVAINFMLDRLAAAAQMLRDATADAYAAAADEKVGYPGITVRDVENGTIVPTERAAGG